ncbi:MAG: type II toxin-antitoxin system VapC family toxin [Bifidobacteriaceae bacterium]|jgi:PIN domain nuclease of toxin-antitoxin system|nr:type II toxin-antitoxin system VapC family toxin [Bifidobacteriaceae bacterium]
MGVRRLLDTHVFLWLIGSPDRLGPDLLADLADPATEIIVSAATAMEIATKVRAGKLPEAVNLASPAGWRRAVSRLGARTADLTPEHCLMAGSLAWGNRDPFDRFLAAQAIALSLPLVTADPAFGDVEGLAVRW